MFQCHENLLSDKTIPAVTFSASDSRASISAEAKSSVGVVSVDRSEFTERGGETTLFEIRAFFRYFFEIAPAFLFTKGQFRGFLTKVTYLLVEFAQPVFSSFQPILQTLSRQSNCSIRQTCQYRLELTGSQLNKSKKILL